MLLNIGIGRSPYKIYLLESEQCIEVADVIESTSSI